MWPAGWNETVIIKPTRFAIGAACVAPANPDAAHATIAKVSRVASTDPWPALA